MKPNRYNTFLTSIFMIATAFPAGAFADSFVPAGDSHVCYMGRWDLKPDAATTVNSGAAIRFRFKGRGIKGRFDTATISAPPEIYVSIDDGPQALIIVKDRELNLAPEKLSDDKHRVEIVVKSVDQGVNRWTPPLKSALIFSGFELDKDGAALDPAPALVDSWSPHALKMEFCGDSITEGIRALNMSAGPDGCDGTRSYSYLTGLAFGANITQVGFGGQGLTHGGGGDVPSVEETFAFNFAGSPINPGMQPDVVVINQGTNDGGAAPAIFEPAYVGLLKKARATCPQALIFALRPFNGTQAASIRSAVAAMRDPRIIYVDTTGWLEISNSPDYTEKPIGLHPSLSGHAKAAKRLTEALRAAGVGTPTAAGPSR